jgi:hypothetical protein
MTLQLLHSEFPYIWGNFDFLFYQCSLDICIRTLALLSHLSFLIVVHPLAELHLIIVEAGVDLVLLIPLLLVPGGGIAAVLFLAGSLVRRLSPRVVHRHGGRPDGRGRRVGAGRCRCRLEANGLCSRRGREAARRWEEGSGRRTSRRCGRDGRGRRSRRSGAVLVQLIVEEFRRSVVHLHPQLWNVHII